MVLFLLACSSADALDPAQLKPQGYVSDFAAVLDAGSRAELEKYCERVEQSTGAQIAVVTIKSLGDDPIEDFANNLFRSPVEFALASLQMQMVSHGRFVQDPCDHHDVVSTEGLKPVPRRLQQRASCPRHVVEKLR